MYSLIITIKSIEAVSRLLTGDSALQVINYQSNNGATLEQDDDYSVPSLIWPPPSTILQSMLKGGLL